MLKLSVNILCWNNWLTLSETLKVLADELRHVPYELIVVDNGSTDQLKDLPGADNFHIIRFSKNVGISKGKNAGIQASQGEYILLLDGDIIPVKNSISCLVQYLDGHGECQAIGFYPNKFSAQRNNDNGQKHHEDFCFMLYEPTIHRQAIIYYGMFRRGVFDKVMLCEEGPFGEIGYGWEDTDFFMQMKRAGIAQWVAGINHITGKYFHAINSSIKIMGYDAYIKTSKERAEFFRKRWGLERG